MCLTKVTEVFKRPNNKEVVGYKVVDIDINLITLPWQSSYKIQVNTWMKADTSYTVEDETINRTQYKSGFHVFLSKEEAKKYTWGNSIVKVLVRKVFVRGTQRIDVRVGSAIEANCVVAKEMFIPFPYEEFEKTSY